MDNFKQFRSLVDEYLKTDETYRIQIETFMKYLEDNQLQNQVFNLYSKHIDDFFESLFETKIGVLPTLTRQIVALKALFGFLMSREYKFAELNGYICDSRFKERLSVYVEQSRNKEKLPSDLLLSILQKVDDFIDNNSAQTQKKDIFLRFLIARLFIKLSLILPLKATQMLDICVGDITNPKCRTILHNGITIKIPNNLRKDIIYAIHYVEEKYGKTYSKSDKIFHFLCHCLIKKITTTSIRDIVERVYEILEINEMLETIPVGKKEMHIYTAECYKLTAIANMLENGVNIVYLTKLTGLDIGTLVSTVDLEKQFSNRDVVSTDINNAMLASEYYEYL